MSKISQTLDSAAQPNAVWELAASLSRTAEWNSMHGGFAGDVPDTLREGITYCERLKLMGMPAEISWRVIAAEAPAKLELAGDGPMGVKVTARWLIAAADNGSHVTWELEFTGGALNGPMAKMVDKQAGSATRVSLDKFGQLLG